MPERTAPRMTSAKDTQVIAELRRAHQSISELVTQGELCKTLSEQKHLAEILYRALERYFSTIEVIIFPGLARRPGGKPVAESLLEQNNQLRDLVATLPFLDAASTEWSSTLSAISSAISDQKRYEEGEIFPLLEQTSMKSSA